MTALTKQPTTLTTGWYHVEDCRLADLRELVEVATRLADYPHADAVLENVLVYGPRLAEHTSSPDRRRVVRRSWLRRSSRVPGSLCSSTPSTQASSTTPPRRSTG